MRDFDSLTFHPTTERIVEILCNKTQNDNPEFFRINLSYYLGKITASMRVKLATQDRGEIPVNIYAINLAPSGYGKGHSTNIIEEQLIHHFRNVFFDDTYPVVAEQSLMELAAKRAAVQSMDEAEMLEAVQKEFAELGKLAFSFDSATSPAIKQMRHKLLMANIGAANMEIDEIGNNLIGNTEALTTYLELYDVGKIKQKLTKNTKESVRSEEIDGRTPANLLMYGVPTRLFDGGKTEEALYEFLDSGYARRTLFGFAKQAKKAKHATPEEVFDALTDNSTNQYLKDMAVRLGNLASIVNHNKVIEVPRKVSILGIEYKMLCEKKAADMRPHEEIQKAEMTHRYFKALKLAGVYAFIDGDSEVTIDNYYHAVHMVEESGKAFDKIMARDQAWVKLAKYLGNMDHEVTHAELQADLPFFRGSVAAKQELIQLAAAWGYKNHTVIKKTMVSGVEFLSADALKVTDLDRLILSHSDDISDGYQNVTVPWDKLHLLTQKPMSNWINHHSVNGHRSEDYMIPGFDMVVLDMDGGTTVKEFMLFMQDYKYMIYTTKRHTNQEHRFRVVMPMNYHLNLDGSDYRAFMKNIYEWLPFEKDTGTVDRCRKWLTNDGQYHYHNGEKLLDVRLFIPKTTRSDEQKTFIATYQSMTNMERWFVNNSEHGNRNNQLARYALLMVDLGYPSDNIRDNVLAMNDKLKDKLTIKEIDATIMKSVASKIRKLAQP